MTVPGRDALPGGRIPDDETTDDGCASGLGGGTSPPPTPPAGSAPAPAGAGPPYEDDPRRGLHRLPGEGATPHDSCGRVKKAVGCPAGRGSSRTQAQARLGDFAGAKHRSGVVREHCDRAACPRCWESWKNRQAKRAGERVRAFRAAAKTRGKERHFQISPPPELVAEWRDHLGDDRAVELVLEHAIKIAKKRGLFAFGAVVHPWRTHATGAGRYRRGKNYFSPHVHVVAFGALQDAATFHEETGGWVYKNLTEENGYAEPEAIFSYILDHAGVRSKDDQGKNGKQVLRWIGKLSSKHFVIDKETSTKEPIHCDCGRPCREYGLTVDDEISWDDDRGPYLATVRKRTYRLNKSTATARSVDDQDAPDDVEIYEDSEGRWRIR